MATEAQLYELIGRLTADNFILKLQVQALGEMELNGSGSGEEKAPEPEPVSDGD